LEIVIRLVRWICLRIPFQNSKFKEVLCAMGIEKIKTNKVNYQIRQSRSRFPQGKDKIVPFIRLSGLWLEMLGFKIGQAIEIYSPGKAQLLLKGISRFGKVSNGRETRKKKRKRGIANG
jgi:hypothetical protein